jgi:hypothetical protein
MLRIVVGGQIMKSEIFDFIEKYYGKGNVELAIKNDLDAVMAMKAGQFDYYIGACNTGGGGALAMAIALLGPSKCQTISMPGKIFSDEDIQKAVDSGKIAFGFTAQHMENVLPVWLKAIDAKNVG